MVHTKFYSVCKYAFQRGTYTIDMVYNFTTLESNALTAEEFEAITGMTVEEYQK